MDSVQIVAVPEAGEGVTLSFRNSDKRVLQTLFGDNWFMGATARLNRFDMEFIAAALKVGGKQDGAPFAITDDVADKIPTAEIANRINDALYLSMHGKTFAAYLKHVLDEEAKAKAEGKGEPESPR